MDLRYEDIRVLVLDHLSRHEAAAGRLCGGIYIYIYICRERERERETLNICILTYISCVLCIIYSYIYIYIYIHNYMQPRPQRVYYGANSITTTYTTGIRQRQKQCTIWSWYEVRGMNNGIRYHIIWHNIIWYSVFIPVCVRVCIYIYIYMYTHIVTIIIMMIIIIMNNKPSPCSMSCRYFYLSGGTPRAQAPLDLIWYDIIY